MADQSPSAPQVPSSRTHGTLEARPAGAGGGTVLPFLFMLRRHAWFLLAMALVGLGAAAYRVYTAAPQYRATAVIRLVDAAGALTRGIGGAGTSAGPVLSQVQLLRSRSLAEDAVDAASLRLRSATPGFAVEQLSGVFLSSSLAPDTVRVRFTPDSIVVEGSPGKASAAYGEPVRLDGLQLAVPSHPRIPEAVLVIEDRNRTVSRVQRKLRAQLRPGTDVVDLEYVDADPVFAQRAINAAIVAFQARNKLQAQSQSARRREFIENQLAETDLQLSAAQGLLSDFRRREGVFRSTTQIQSQQSELTQVRMRRSELEADRQVFASLLTEIHQAPPEERASRIETLASAPGVASNPTVSALYGQLRDYQSRLGTLTTGVWSSSETNPDVQRLRALVDTTTEKLIVAVESHISVVDARLASLNELERKQVAALDVLPEQEAEEEKLSQRVRTLQALSERLQQEFQGARIGEAVEEGQVEIVDLAQIPDAPLSQNRTRTLLFGLAAGLAFGVLTIQFWDRLDHGIHGVEDLEEILGMSNFGVIPSFRARSRFWARAGLSSDLRGSRGRRKSSRDLVVVLDPRSSSAEAFRTLRANLVFSSTAGALKTILVTSSLPGEGKTVTAANLAAAMALQGQSVLLIDADMRRPRAHDVLGAPLKPGLSHYLTGQCQIEDCVHATAVPGLSLLPAGRPPRDPWKLIGAKHTHELVGVLAGSFDIVILDSPPILPASDASVLSTLTDLVLVVVRAGATPGASVQEAVQQLSQVGTARLVTVLNDPDRDLVSYGYGRRYYHVYYGETE